MLQLIHRNYMFLGHQERPTKLPVPRRLSVLNVWLSFSIYWYLWERYISKSFTPSVFIVNGDSVDCLVSHWCFGWQCTIMLLRLIPLGLGRSSWSFWVPRRHDRQKDTRHIVRLMLIFVMIFSIIMLIALMWVMPAERHERVSLQQKQCRLVSQDNRWNVPLSFPDNLRCILPFHTSS